uniref:Phospholipase n=1 Tax=Pseudomonas phage vB_PaeM_FBPa36 TaxID=3231237 RepID=A0AAU8KW82_9VIRU
MPGIAVCNMDSAGGVILPGPNVKCFYKGQPFAVIGCAVAGHGRTPHDSARMIQGSVKMAITGIPVCLQGSMASCGHTATGRPNLTCGS